MAPESSTPEQTRAQCAAMHARVMAQFDDVDATIARIREQMIADGLMREPSERTRLGEAHLTEVEAAALTFAEAGAPDLAAELLGGAA